MSGSLSVLNCGAGDIKVSFKNDDPMEIERAKRIIGDMLKRGYVLFVETGVRKGKPVLAKVEQFDEKHSVYWIADGPAAQPMDEELAPEAAASHVPPRKGKRGLKMSRTKATAIAPTSGG